MRTAREMTHEDASLVIDAVRAELEARGLGAAVAVVDAHGELVAFRSSSRVPPLERSV